MNCKDHNREHRWPLHGPGGALRTIGNVWYETCNNCLCVRVKFEKDIKVGEEWVRIEDTQIIEPNFKQPLDIN